MNDNFEIITLKKGGIADFAKERNTLLKKAKKEWVLFLDSDEVLTPELITEIDRVVSKSKSINGYYLKRKNYFLGQYAGTDKILRLGRKNAGQWERRVHETWKISGRVGSLKNSIIHNTANKVSEMVDKINNYSTLHARVNRDEGKKTSLFRIVIYPKVKFIQSMLSGRGLVFSMLQSFHSFLAWAKQWELQKN